MTRLYLALVFAVLSLSGLGLILYGVLAGRNGRPACEKGDVLGFLLRMNPLDFSFSISIRVMKVSSTRRRKLSIPESTSPSRSRAG